MKAEILAYLRACDGYLSGQELCKHFNVTRSAVWKAIHQLQKEGYEIEAVQNKGYRLISAGVYGEAEIKSRIQTKWAGKELKYFDSTTSTNLLAKQAGEEGGVHGTLFVADEQTAGRGRRGRVWESPKGANIYFTILLRPEIDPNKASMLTLVMAHSVANAIGRLTGMTPGIKWPNDILLDGRKVCGILTEMSAEKDYMHYVVCGVGINVQKQDFPEDLRIKAGTIEEITKNSVSKAHLLQLIMEEFEKDYESFIEAESLAPLQESYDALLLNRDAEVKILDPKGEWTGIARGINAEGELLVETAEGEVTAVYAGEVSVRGMDGYV